jgi:hypothetical protein
MSFSRMISVPQAEMSDNWNLIRPAIGAGMIRIICYDRHLQLYKMEVLSAGYYKAISHSKNDDDEDGR